MPFFIEYLIKLSIGISVVCAFYYLFLRRLTFYNWNRWYLLGYSVLACLLPILDVMPLLAKNNLSEIQVIQAVPSISTATSPGIIRLNGENAQQGFTIWQIIQWIIYTGTIILAFRFLLQIFSFLRMKNLSRPIDVNGYKVYHLDQHIKPFSFGNSIFINTGLHSEPELKEIVRHEFIHIKQKHTLDILWCELLILVNWYNPFTWILRRAMRQNLEFIADNKVIETGVDRRSYQYLLLKVIGERNFSVANNFNYSSLKTRIAMMNKIKSARIHLLRFLFILPLLCVLLISFRNKTEASPELRINYGGIAFDIDTKLPISGATIVDMNSGAKSATDRNGYFFFSFNVKEEMDMRLQFSKNGFINHIAGFSFKGNKNGTSSLVQIVGMKAGAPDAKCDGCFNSVSLDYVNSPSLALEDVQSAFTSYLNSMKEQEHAKVEAEEPGNHPKGIILEASGEIITNENGKMCAMGDVQVTIADDATGLIIYEQKKYSPKEFRSTFKPDRKFNTATLYSSGKVPSEYGEAGKDGVLILGRADCKPEIREVPIVQDTLPANPTGRALHRDDNMNEEASRFFKRNANVRLLYWKPRSRSIEVYLDNSEVELYELPGQLRDFENKYGPMPIESGSRGRSVTRQFFNHKGYYLDIVDNKGECTVSVINKENKEIARVPMNSWSKENIAMYGHLPE